MDGKTWVLDSGASRHMTCYASCFQSVSPYRGQPVKVGNGQLLEVKGSGKVVLACPHELTLEDVLYVPDLAANLLSVHKLYRSSMKVKFSDDGNMLSSLMHKKTNEHASVQQHQDCTYSMYSLISYA